MRSVRELARIKNITTAACVAALLLPAAAAAAPKAPVPSAPADDAKVEAIGSFSWKAVKRADRYQFQLAADSKFGSIVLGKGHGSFETRNRYATIDESLGDGSYFWRVRAINRKDQAGKWSHVRSLRKSAGTAPNLVAPEDESDVQWPGSPLVLQWTPVPRAVHYQVVIATDPSLASPLIGTPSKPVETSGTVFALPAALAPGRYYWAVIPLDAQDHPGARSAVGSFKWTWNSATTARLHDLRDDARVFEPQFSWDPVLGAARYEVEVNKSDDWAPGSRVCCTDPTTGTSLSPLRVLANNRYYWRVRAFDPDGNAGRWNAGVPFDKDFDHVVGQPTVTGLHLRDNLADPAVDLDPGPGAPETEVPIVSWDPVPGASSYEVQVVPADYYRTATEFVAGCDWTAPTSLRWDVTTAATSWTALGRSLDTPSGISYPNASHDPTPLFLRDGWTYCARVAAQSDRDATNDPVVSDWTQLHGNGQRGFTWRAAPQPSGAEVAMPADHYVSPQAGIVHRRLPLFTWRAVTGANSYYVVVAKDALFTNVVDVAHTYLPAYAPRINGRPWTYPDETTTYYWAVYPAQFVNGVGVSTTFQDNHPQPFQKQSVPPALLSPAPGSDVPVQPAFRWSPAEGARNYTLQVSQDPTFGDPIQTVKTAATAYTSSASYPADTVLYWRVRANDENELGLGWSPTGTFRRRLPAPVLAADNPLTGTAIPLLRWSPVIGAVSYALHVDQADGTRKDFTLRSPAFTPTAFYGTGIWRWKVRANFPAGMTQVVGGGYSAAQAYTRTIGAPTGVAGIKGRGRMLFSWQPEPSAERYRVELSASSSFSKLIDSVTTDHTEWAPTLTRTGFSDGGKIYWRVAAVDEGRNVGAFKLGSFGLPKALKLRLSGALKSRTRGQLTVTVANAKGNAVRGVKLKVAGVGVRGSKRSNKRGIAKFSLKPQRRGTLKVTANKRGFRTTRATTDIR